MSRNNNVFGEGFNPVVIKQIAIRQKVYGSGYLDTPRTVDETLYLNANTSWCKLVSSVNLVPVTSGVSATTIGSDDLAKKYILFNGTADNGKIREDAYGISNEKLYGLKPMMGILSAVVTYENRGSIRKAEVKIKAWDTEQFQIIEKLYLRLGFTILLEWGHSMYYDNLGALQNNENNSLSDEFLGGNSTQTDFLDKIYNTRLSSFGNYDAMFGRVANFDWSLDKDGSYNISIKILSLGDIIESLTINGSFPSVNVNIDNEDGSTGVPADNFERIKAARNSSNLAAYLYDIAKQLHVVTDKNNTLQAPGSTDTFATQIRYSNPLNAKPDFEYYIKLGTLIKFIGENIIPEIIVSPTVKSSLMDMLSENSIMYYYPNLISYDPRICVINTPLYFKEFSTTPVGSTSVYPYRYALGNPFNIYIGEVNVGDIMNIYVNINFIIDQLYSLKDDRWKINLYNFLKGICSGINTAFGGKSNLDVFIDEDNHIVKIYDQNPIPNLDDILDKYKMSKEVGMFDVYGYKTNGVSFVKDLDFKSFLPPEFATMIFIGAQSNSNVTGENSSALANLNSSYIDRFKTDIQEPNTNAKKVIDDFFTEFDFTQTFLTDAQKTAIEEKSTLNALQEAYDKYYESYIAFLKDLAIDKPISPILDKVMDMRASTTQGITVQSSDSNLIPIINPNDISNFSNVQLSFDNFEEQINIIKYKATHDNKSPISTRSGFLPFNLSLTVDGLSGMKINQQFMVDTEYLPSNYPETLRFLIKNISHEISNNKWFTKIESYMISKGEDVNVKNIHTYEDTKIRIRDLTIPNSGSNNNNPIPNTGGAIKLPTNMTYRYDKDGIYKLADGTITKDFGFTQIAQQAGGTGGDWGGSMQRAAVIAELVNTHFKPKNILPQISYKQLKRTEYLKGSNETIGADKPLFPNMIKDATRKGDHHVGNVNAYACDFGCSETIGNEMYQLIMAWLADGDPNSEFANPQYLLDAKFKGFKSIVKDGYSYQILWHVAGHYNHLHVGVHKQ